MEESPVSNSIISLFFAGAIQSHSQRGCPRRVCLFFHVLVYNNYNRSDNNIFFYPSLSHTLSLSLSLSLSLRSWHCQSYFNNKTREKSFHCRHMGLDCGPLSALETGTILLFNLFFDLICVEARPLNFLYPQQKWSGAPSLLSWTARLVFILCIID